MQKQKKIAGNHARSNIAGFCFAVTCLIAKVESFVRSDTNRNRGSRSNANNTASVKMLTSIKATMMAPTITNAEFSTAHNIREMDRPPTSVNFSISGSLVKESLKPLRKPLQKTAHISDVCI